MPILKTLPNCLPCPGLTGKFFRYLTLISLVIFLLLLCPSCHSPRDPPKASKWQRTHLSSPCCGCLTSTASCSPLPSTPSFPPPLNTSGQLSISPTGPQPLPPSPGSQWSWIQALTVGSGLWPPSRLQGVIRPATPQQPPWRYKYSHMPGPAPCLRAGAGLLPQAWQASHMPHKCHGTTGPSQQLWGDQLGPDLSGWMDDGWVDG